MTAAIVGSRTFGDYDALVNFIYKVCVDNRYEITEVVSGGAIGTDKLAERFADAYGLKKTVLKADWRTYGRKAGYLRNIDIIKACDICIAAWNGESRGTKHDIDLCEEYGKPCYIYKFN